MRIKFSIEENLINYKNPKNYSEIKIIGHDLKLFFYFSDDLSILNFC